MFFNKKQKAALPYSGAVRRAEDICGLLTVTLDRLQADGTLTDEELDGLRALRESLHYGWVLAERADRLARPASPPQLLCPLRGVECTSCTRPCDMGN